MNPRIRKVRVSRNGKVLATRQLDITARTLQDLPVDAAGGDFKLEVLEIAAGSKLGWREICVSELEVWGTPPAGTGAAPTRPTVRVGSLDRALVLGLRGDAGGGATLPLALAVDGWVYLGHEDVDPGRGALRAERAFHDPAAGVIGYDLRRGVDPARLPARYRAAKALRVAVYDSALIRKCDGVLDVLEVAARGLLPPAMTNPSDAELDAAKPKLWRGPFTIVAQLNAPCKDAAHWVRSAALPPLAALVHDDPPAWLAGKVTKLFRASLDDQQRKLATRPYLGFVPAAAGRDGYVSASFYTDDCNAGQFAIYAIWRVRGRELDEIPVERDDLAGAVDLDGDGQREVLTTYGEIDGNDYLAWWQDLTAWKPAHLGCDGHD